MQYFPIPILCAFSIAFLHLPQLIFCFVNQFFLHSYLNVSGAAVRMSNRNSFQLLCALYSLHTALLPFRSMHTLSLHLCCNCYAFFLCLRILLIFLRLYFSCLPFVGCRLMVIYVCKFCTYVHKYFYSTCHTTFNQNLRLFISASTIRRRYISMYIWACARYKWIAIEVQCTTLSLLADTQG